MPDETQHVIDAIDGALADWTVSGDAMRWTPDPPPDASVFKRAHLNEWTPGRTGVPDGEIVIGWDGIGGAIWTDEETDLRDAIRAVRTDALVLAMLTPPGRIVIISEI